MGRDVGRDVVVRVRVRAGVVRRRRVRRVRKEGNLVSMVVVGV